MTFLVMFVVLFLKKYFSNTINKKHENNNTQKVELLRVVDGDTLIARLNNKKERLRLVGMNAPESVKPNSPVECFGQEASHHIKDILGHSSSLKFMEDFSQGSRDRFGRLLGYIFIDEKNLAEQMIFDGYAYEYTYHKNHPYKYQYDFKRAEKNARKEKRGLWADESCKE